MRKLPILLILLIFTGLAVVLSSCGAKGGSDANNDTLTMHSYTVPDSRAEALSETLNQLLRMDNGKQDVGRAWVAAPGQILVMAPADMQESIADSIKDIVSRQDTSNQVQTLRLNAWIVDTYPGQGPQDPSLKSIQPALEAFAADLGPQHFMQAHYFTAVSDAGSQVDLLPLVEYRLSYAISKTDNGLLLKFEYSQPPLDQSQGRRPDSLQGQITTQLGQNLVLGLVADRSKDLHTGPIRELLVIRIVPANHS
jgi:hypothetical protein